MINNKRRDEDEQIARLSRQWAEAHEKCDASEFVELVLRLLKRFRFTGEFSRLAGDREGLIQQFMIEKFLEKKTVLKHSTALYSFFVNFLKDEARSYRQRNVRSESELVSDSPDSDGSEPSTSVIDRFSKPEDFTEEVSRVLTDYSLTQEQMCRSVLDRLKSWEPWTLIYLGQYFFAPHGQKKSLGSLAKHHQIKSFSYKINRLGVRVDSNDRISFSNFEKTWFGEWIKHLLRGESIGHDDRDLIVVAMHFLEWGVLEMCATPQLPHQSLGNSVGNRGLTP